MYCDVAYNNLFTGSRGTGTEKGSVSFGGVNYPTPENYGILWKNLPKKDHILDHSPSSDTRYLGVFTGEYPLRYPEVALFLKGAQA